MIAAVYDEQENRLRASSANAWDRLRSVGNAPVIGGRLPTANERRDFLDNLMKSSIELSAEWVNLAKLLSADMQRDAIDDYCAIGNRVVPLVRAVAGLFEQIQAMLDSPTALDMLLSSELEFQRAGEDLKGAQEFLGHRPMSVSEHILAVREEIARGETFPAAEMATECGTN